MFCTGGRRSLRQECSAAAALKKPGASGDAHPQAMRNDPFAEGTICVTIRRKYVNMTDLNFSPAPSAVPTPARVVEPVPLYDLIELLFFAYRDFVADADHLLEAYGFGRAHHRVLHFVDRNPNLMVAELLDILKITKQSLARVLKDLIDQGFILQREGEEDRRQRLLATTPRGHALASELAVLQSKRIAAALGEAGPDSHAQASRFLFALVERGERPAVHRLVHHSKGRLEE